MAFSNTFQADTQIEIQRRAFSPGLAQLATTVALIGAKTAAGAATADMPVIVLDNADAETKFGVGSELAIMCRWAFQALADAQVRGVTILGVPAAPAAGTARALTFTVTGTASAAGENRAVINGVECVAAVAAGDAQNTSATNLQAAINARTREHGFTATVLANVVTATAESIGVNANEAQFSVPQTAQGVTILAAESVAGVGAVSIANALAALVTEDVQYLAIANHTTTDITATLAHVTSTWAPTARRWRWIVVGSRSLTEADTLAGAANERAIVVACTKNAITAPHFIAPYVAVRFAAIPQANQPMDNLELLSVPKTPARLLDTEIETYGRRGVCLLDLNATGTRMRLVRAVTTQTTIGGITDTSQLDITVGRSQVEFARQLDAVYGGPDFVNTDATPVLKTAATKQLMRSAAIRVARNLEAIKVLRDVDSFLPLFTVRDSTDDPSIPVDTVRVDAPAAVVPALRHKQVTIMLYQG